MKSLRRRLPASGFGALAVLMLSACAVTGGGVEGGVGYAGYDAGYYAPYGYDYGDWGIGYAVAPSRCCDHRDDHRDDHRNRPDRGHGGHRPAYRPAPAGRAAPSIPSRHRTR